MPGTVEREYKIHGDPGLTCMKTKTGSQRAEAGTESKGWECTLGLVGQSNKGLDREAGVGIQNQWVLVG